MYSTLAKLFNNGENNGDIILKTQSTNLKCHSFVLENTSDFFKKQICHPNFDGLITLDFTNDIVSIVIQYLYCEEILHKELSTNDIIDLYNLIDIVNCSLLIPLKQYYLNQFSKLINIENWAQLLNCTFGNSKYSELQNCLQQYCYDVVLNNLTETDEMGKLMEQFTQSSDAIKILVFSYCVKKLAIHNISNGDSKLSMQRRKTMNTIIRETCDAVSDSDTSDDDSKSKKKSSKKVGKK